MIDQKAHHLSPPPPSEPKGQVLKFRRRGKPLTRPPTPLVDDLKKFEAPPESSEDYRHRMLVNGAGLLVALLLVATGFWIFDTMAKMRKDQDCVLSGRRNCADISAQIAPR